jgi:peroxiredoxin
MRKNLLAIIVILGLVAYGAYDYFNKNAVNTAESGEALNEELERGIIKGKLAPDFELNDLEGNPVSLSDLRGKIVMVNFWATWCPPCRIEMPHMQKFYEEHQSKDDVVILGVNLTPTEEKLDAIRTFVDDQGLTFPIVLDPDGDVMQTYQVMAYPTTYILDTKGVIREKFQGAINYDIMKEAVSQIR